MSRGAAFDHGGARRWALAWVQGFSSNPPSPKKKKKNTPALQYSRQLVFACTTMDTSQSGKRYANMPKAHRRSARADGYRDGAAWGELGGAHSDASRPTCNTRAGDLQIHFDFNKSKMSSASYRFIKGASYWGGWGGGRGENVDSSPALQLSRRTCARFISFKVETLCAITADSPSQRAASAPFHTKSKASGFS